MRKLSDTKLLRPPGEGRGEGNKKVALFPQPSISANRRRVPAGSGWPFLDRKLSDPRQDGFVALGQGFADRFGERVKEGFGVLLGQLGGFSEGFDQFFLGAHWNFN